MAWLIYLLALVDLVCSVLKTTKDITQNSTYMLAQCMNIVPVSCFNVTLNYQCCYSSLASISDRLFWNLFHLHA